MSSHVSLNMSPHSSAIGWGAILSILLCKKEAMGPNNDDDDNDETAWPLWRAYQWGVTGPLWFCPTLQLQVSRRAACTVTGKGGGAAGAGHLWSGASLNLPSSGRYSLGAIWFGTLKEGPTGAQGLHKTVRANIPPRESGSG